MALLDIGKLALDAFLKLNLERYKDNAEMVAALNRTTLDTLIFGSGVKNGTNYSCTITDKERVFIGHKQSWDRVTWETILGADKVTTVADEAEVVQQIQTGMYKYMTLGNPNYVFVVGAKEAAANGWPGEQKAKAALDSILQWALSDNPASGYSYKVNSDGSILIDNMTMLATAKWRIADAKYVIPETKYDLTK